MTAALHVVVLVALLAAVPVAAKEGVRARLATSIPLDAMPGTRLDVAWTLTSVDEDGQRRPFGASGVYVRLLSASGADAETGFAQGSTGQGSTGEYTATVVVPEGGIGDVEIGLVGLMSDATGTRRADALFPITNDPVPGAARAASPASEQRGSEPADTSSAQWILVGVVGSLVALAAVAVGLVRRRHARGETARTAGAP